MDIRAAAEMAKEQLQKHGLQNWRFEWDNAKKRFGRCSPRKQLITISKLLTELNTEEHFLDTLLHEIAHALAPIGSGHGYHWKKIAVSIGCNGQRCYTADVVLPKLKYTTTCPSCGKVGQTARRREKLACGKCCRQYNGGRYSDKYILIYTLNN